MKPEHQQDAVIARSPNAERDALPNQFADARTLVNHSDYARILSQRGESTERIAIHIRLPFCPSRCLSCDHHTTVEHRREPIDQYLEALEHEIALVTDRIGSRHPLAQLHLGGGSPNYLSETQLVRLMEIVEKHFSIDSRTRASLEANPRHCGPSQLQLLNGLGFGSISLQVRDLDPRVQAAIGRTLSPAMLQDVVDNARGAGIGTVGLDLVYGLPAQTPDGMRRTLDHVLAMRPDRLLCHAFSRRPGIFKHQAALAEGDLPSIADKVAMFNSLSETLVGAGYHWVGLDAFALEGDELARASAERTLHHNWIGYTGEVTEDLFGFGADAVSELAEATLQNHVHSEDWSASIGRGELPVASGVALPEEARRRQRALSELLCNLELRGCDALLGSSDDPGPLADLAQEGVVCVQDGVACITPAGRVMLHQRIADASPHFRGWAFNTLR